MTPAERIDRVVALLAEALYATKRPNETAVIVAKDDVDATSLLGIRAALRRAIVELNALRDTLNQ